MVLDKTRSSFRSFVHQRLALLQGQLLKCREEQARIKYDGSDDGQQLQVLTKRETILKEKIHTLEQEDVGHERDTLVHPIFVCNECYADIEYDDDAHPRYHCIECNDYDECGECAHSLGHEHACYADTLDTGTIQKELLKLRHVPLMIDAAFRMYANRPCLGEPSADCSWSWLTFSQVYHRCCVFMSGLLRCVPGCTAVGIAGRNTIDWMVVDLACLIAGIVVVPMQADLRGESIQHVSRNGRLSAAIIAPELRDRFEEHLDCPLFEFGEISGHDMPIQVGRASDDTLVTLIHTSGSTGLPKGARMTDLVWSRLLIEGVEDSDPLVNVSKDSLAHISDREGVHSTLCHGGRTGMIAHVQDVMPCLNTLQPCTLGGAPRFWDSLRCRYEAQLSGGAEEAPLKARYAAMFGARLRWITLGGASCPDSTKRWLLSVWGKHVVSDGYACTEAGQLADDDGTIYRRVQWRLRAVPDLGYAAVTPPRRGEFLCKTPYTIQGYVSADATQSAFDCEGYFCTGDIVEITDEQGNGKLRIIDRVKSYFKLSQGVFIAPAQLENAYLGCKDVDQIIVLHADLKKYNQACVSAVVRTRADNVSELDILEQLHREASACGLKAFERPSVVIVTRDDWSVANGLMTASNKLNRLPLIRKYREALDERWRMRRSGDFSGSTGRDIAHVICAALNVSMARLIFSLTLKQQGADSLAVLQCSHQLHISFGAANSATVEELLSAHGEPIDECHVDAGSLERDSQFSCPLADSEETPEIRRVLLTGSAGFLGQRLLDVMLEETQWHLVALIHRKRPAVRRVHAARVDLVSGDVSLENLGIQGDYQVDTIIHCGGKVSHLESYKEHHSANVLGTKRVIEFSRRGTLKRLYFISSISVLGLSASEAAQQGGYVASKWVAERLVAQLRDTSRQTLGILRLGMVSWDDRGKNDVDWLCRLITGCRGVGCAPGSARQLDIIPREAACLQCLQRISSGDSGAWNIVNSSHKVSYNDLFQWLGIDLVPESHWLEKARNHKGLALFVDGIPDDSDQPIYEQASEGTAITKDYCLLFDK